MRSSNLLAFSIALLLALSSGLAQLATARLEGTLQDDSGALIPGAKVEATNGKTLIRLESTTNEHGRFLFATLQPSEYILTAEAAGFRKAVRNGVILNVGGTVTEVIKLEIGSITESVVVAANTVRV